MTGARSAAAHVLVRVAKDGAFAAAALEAELARAVQLDARDRALATELVYGTLRVAPWLDAQIARFAPRGLAKVDERALSHLRLAAYQLFFTRVPPFAAVSEAVDAVRAARGERVASFANAVLRKVAGRAAAATETDRAEAVVSSAPAWLRAALERALSPDEARAFLASGAEPPPVALRVERAPERGPWLGRLRVAAPDAAFDPGRVSPLAILARGAGRPQGLPGYTDGAWSIQEEGSQTAALAVGVRAGETVLDACAGRGNKTAVLARRAGDRGAVDACDATPSKLDRLAAELARLGLHARRVFGVDWTRGSGEVTALYDRVLVDAPCTGVGTLRRRPDLALRRKDEDLAAMARTQLAIARGAAAHVRAGGSLTYVVCSVLREEAEEVVAGLLAELPEFAPSPFDAPEARAIAGDATSFRLLPQVHGTDGYFVARLVRKLEQSERAD
ncbi:MAG TPA: transcription antitermination factor NusB [Polyangiaceae bacterium]|nr:transcription antitermination factor NusB [Polyangiaceae bacterium]